jgi:hypothetical protein
MSNLLIDVGSKPKWLALISHHVGPRDQRNTSGIPILNPSYPAAKAAHSIRPGTFAGDVPCFPHCYPNTRHIVGICPLIGIAHWVSCRHQGEKNPVGVCRKRKNYYQLIHAQFYPVPCGRNTRVRLSGITIVLELVVYERQYP